MTEHTPAPVRIEGAGRYVGAPMIVSGEHGSPKDRHISTYREVAQVRLYLGSEDMSLAYANAEYLVRSWNNFEPLLEALEKAQQAFYDYQMEVDEEPPYKHRLLMKEINEVITKAKEANDAH